MSLDIHRLLQTLASKKASDLHLLAGSPPLARVDGRLAPLGAFPVLTPEDTAALLETMISAEDRLTFRDSKELDFTYTEPGRLRIRGNACLQKGSVKLSLRSISLKVPTLEELDLPDVLAELSCQSRGLILVCGPTGSGKSTTLAAMLDHINRNQQRMIVTIEDPIEYLHTSQQSAFVQRELGQDTRLFARALRHAMRQDPDVIMVGEMRDTETISLAVTAAETGHLMLTTVHTNSAIEAIDRIVDVFPAAQQPQVRLQLSMSLVAIVYQVLLPRAGGKGRIAACEVLVATPAVRNLVREGKTHQIIAYLELGSSSGMCTLEKSVADLKRRKLIAAETAVAYGKASHSAPADPEARHPD